MSQISKLYYYDVNKYIKGEKIKSADRLHYLRKKALLDSINEDIGDFYKAHGVFPRLLIVREDEWQTDINPDRAFACSLQVEVRPHALQPHHYFLTYSIIERTPRIWKKKRTPVLQ